MRTSTIARRGMLVAFVALLAVLPGAAAEQQLGPKPARCGVGCWGRSATVLSVSYLADVTVEPLIARTGEKITAKVVPMHEALKGWTWPVRGCGKNTAVCTWKAGRAGRRWQVLRMAWENPIGPALTEAVYAIVGKDDAILHGYVRDRTGDGVGGMKLRISKIGGRGSLTASTSGDGYYNATLEPGKYSVIPLARAGKKDEFEPETQTKTVKKGTEVRADFTLDVAMQVKIVASTKRILATGKTTVAVKVKVTREEKPLANVNVDVYLQRSSPAERAAVPAILCYRGARFFPTELPGVAGAGIPDAVTTDAKGEAVLELRGGTVPGRVTVVAWAEDASGRLRSKSIDDVKDTVDVTLDPRVTGGTGGTPTLGAFHDLLEEFAFFTNTTLITSNGMLLADQLQDVGTAGGFGNLIFSPIIKPETGEQAVAVTTGALPLGKGGVITSDAAVVIPFSALNALDSAAFKGFAGAAKARQLPDFPGISEWKSGFAPGWTSKAGSAKSALPSWGYLGWPRSQPGCIV